MELTDFLGLLGGLALFLYGMQMMSDGLEDAAGNRMKQILEKLTSNRLLGVLVGAGITAVIQSSSATTVMVVGFVNSGMMTLKQAVWIIMGANIGTTITGQLIALDVGMLAPLFAFLGVAMIVFLKMPKAHHFGKILAGLGILFIGMDMMGTIVFTTVCLLFPLADFVESLTPNNPESQIANMHTIFNIVTTLLLLPFGTILAELATKILPDSKENANTQPTLAMLSEEFGRNRTSLGTGAIHMDLLHQEIERMLTLAGKNLERSYQIVLDADASGFKKIEETEEVIDALNKEISQYISKILVHNNSDENVADIEEYFLITGNAERIGDHVLNIAQSFSKIHTKYYN